MSFFYILDLLGKMPMKIWFITKVHNKIQSNKEKHWKGVKQTTRYKQTLKRCKINIKILIDKKKYDFQMEVDLWREWPWNCYNDD